MRRTLLALLGLTAGLAGAAPAQNAPAGHGLGLVYATQQDFRSHAHALIARDAARPAQVLLTDYLPPVGDQGHTGSCVGWSTAYYCYTYAVGKQMKLTADQRQDPKFTFSPAYIWHQGNGGDPHMGMRIAQAFDILNTQGCATMKEMPWDESDVTSQPSDEAKARAAKYKAREAVSLFGDDGTLDPEKLKTWLAETGEPLVIGIAVYKDLSFVPHDADFVYTPSTDPDNVLRGGHALCVIGYDDSKHAFRIVNSWKEDDGSDWGDHGQLWFSEDYVKQGTHEAWGQKPGGPVARDASGVTRFPGMPDITLVSAKKALKSR